MAFVGSDPSFDFEPQRLKNLAIHKEAAVIRTIRNKDAFDNQLLNWKQSTLFNQHTPLDPSDPRLVKPSAYIVVSVDEAKHSQRFSEYWNTGLVQLAYDFYIEKAADLPENTWDLTPKNPAPPVNDENPIGGRYINFGAGVFKHVGSNDKYQNGDGYVNAQGKQFTLVRLRDNAFAPGIKFWAWVEDGVGHISDEAKYQGE